MRHHLLSGFAVPDAQKLSQLFEFGNSGTGGDDYVPPALGGMPGGGGGERRRLDKRARIPSRNPLLRRLAGAPGCAELTAAMGSWASALDASGVIEMRFMCGASLLRGPLPRRAAPVHMCAYAVTTDARPLALALSSACPFSVSSPFGVTCA